MIFGTIFWGGLAAGILDAIDGVIAFGTQGANPIQVLQYIASGALAPSAFRGGLATAALFHFFIAWVAAEVYVSASRWMPILKSQALCFGLLSGVAVLVALPEDWKAELLLRTQMHQGGHSW